MYDSRSWRNSRLLLVLGACAVFVSCRASESRSGPAASRPSPRPSADWARISPFEGVRWEGESPDVLLEGAWSELVSIEGVPVERIVASAKSRYGGDASTEARPLWKKRFEEDIVEVLEGVEVFAREHVDVGLRDPATGATRIVADVRMTEEKRRQIRNAAAD